MNSTKNNIIINLINLYTKIISENIQMNKYGI